MRSRRWLILQAGLVAVACRSLATPAENVTGDWDVKLRSSQGELRVKASFKQNGEKLTGAIRLPMGETALAGTLNGTDITFGYTMTTNGRAVRIVMTGVLENNKINGTAEFGGGLRTEWSAIRVMAPITQHADPADMSTVANVTGQWDVTINSPLEARHVKGIFKQEGETISGSLRSAERELATHGTLKGSAISLTYTVQLDGSDVPIALTGLVDGDSIKGSAEFGSGVQGDWAAKRVGAAIEGTPSTNATDVSGTWLVEIETSSGTASPTFTFKQKGQQLTGQYKGAFSEGPLSGTISGNKIAFSFKAEDDSMTFDGAIQDNAMVGTAKLGQFGPGTWTAKRE